MSGSREINEQLDLGVGKITGAADRALRAFAGASFSRDGSQQERATVGQLELGDLQLRALTADPHRVLAPV